MCVHHMQSHVRGSHVMVTWLLTANIGIVSVCVERERCENESRQTVLRYHSIDS